MPALTKRLERIFDGLMPAEVFADVGCDHGYIASEMLKRGKCKRVIITDISEKSLKKAKTLLKRDFDGLFTAIVADGFNGVPFSDEALIAGMGGEEIVKILRSAVALPKTLALQPMKNTDKVRRFLQKSGYKSIKDYTFKAEGKYYDYIIAVFGEEDTPYTEEEYEYGRDNLRYLYDDFTECLKRRRDALFEAAEKVKGDGRYAIEKKIAEIDGIINDDKRVLR